MPDKLTSADCCLFYPEDIAEFFFEEFLDFGSTDSTTSSSSTSVLEAKDPQFYAIQIINALNTHDYNYLFHYLRDISSPHLQISKYVYSFDIIERGLEEREFLSLEEFCQFMEVWNTFLPDGIFEASQLRKCATSRFLSVFISTISFSAQKIVKEVDVLYDDLCVYYPILSQVMMNKLDKSESPEIVILSGSFAISLNVHGFLEKLEFFISKI